MKPDCPHCKATPSGQNQRPRIVCFGRFLRKSDLHVLQRFLCRDCGRTFSTATFDACYQQNKRSLNEPIRQFLSSGMSIRRISLIMRISRTTTARKLKFIGLICKQKLITDVLSRPKFEKIQFDDLETFEHTKLKPLSITLAVESGTRRILGFEVSRMNAKGRLAAIARKKYGRRRDERKKSRRKLFKFLSQVCVAEVEIKSDENPHYPPDVREFFPRGIHLPEKGQRGAITGQGELKKIRFDPLFSLNHTCAMFRANVNRLCRRTWCTTKSVARLKDHLAIYAHFHNSRLP